MGSKLNILLKNPFFQISFAFIIFGLCLLPAFYKVGYGAYLFDEPYQISNGFDFRSTPLAPLSALFTKICGISFGWKWLYFRYIGVSINAMCILIAGLIFYVKTHDYKSFIVITAISLFLGTIFPDVHNLYGWDTWSKLFLMIVICLIFKYFNSRYQSFKLIILIGIASALSILCRFPNIVILPVLTICMMCLSPNCSTSFRARFYSASLVFGVISIVLLFFIIILYGSISQYIINIQLLKIEDHNSLDLLKIIYNDLLKLVPVICMIWGGFIILCQSGNLKNKIWYLPIVFIIYLVIYYNLLTTRSNFCHNLSDYCAAFSILALSGALWYNRKVGPKGVEASIITIFLLCFIPIIGSNTGTQKFLCWTVFPIVCVFLYPYSGKSHKIILGIFVAAILTCGYSIVRYTSFGDSGLLHSNYELKNDVLKGIRTSQNKGLIIDSTIENFKKFADNGYNYLILRQNYEYIYDYVFKFKNQYLDSKFDASNSANDPNYVDWVRNKILENNGKMAILYIVPHDLEMKDYNNDETIMEKMLNAHLTPVIRQREYIIYASE